MRLRGRALRCLGSRNRRVMPLVLLALGVCLGTLALMPHSSAQAASSAPAETKPAAMADRTFGFDVQQPFIDHDATAALGDPSVKIVTTWVAVGNRLDTALPFSLADLKLLDPQDNPFDVNVDPIWVPALKAGDIPGRTVIGGYVSWKVPWHVWPQAVIYKPQGREGGLGVGWGAAFFSDLNYGNRYYTFVGRLFFRGMTSGYGESTYRPDRPITVAQFSKLLVLAVAPYNKADLSYPSGYLQEASRAGLATWGTKGPLAKVTRLEAALAVARAGEDHLAQAPVSYVLPFTDVRGLAKSDIALLAFNGVVRGTATGRFDPQDACTRGQAAKMISIMIDPSLPREEPETTTTLRGSAATVARRATTTTVTTQPTITTTVTSH